MNSQLMKLYDDKNMTKEQDEFNDYIIDVDKFRLFQIKQINSYEYGIKTLNELNDNFLKYICSYNRSNRTYEIRSSIYSIKQLILQSLETFKNNMSETNNLAKSIENSLIITNNEVIRLQSANNQVAGDKSDYENIKLENKNLKDYILKLEQNKMMSINDSKQVLEEIKSLKEANQMHQLDRRRIKYERLNLLNQIKELYKTIEAKENEMREFLRHYEAKTIETSNSLKRIIEAKNEAEIQKNKYLNENLILVEENNQMKILLSTKDTIIQDLQKHLNETKMKCPRYSSYSSYSKESDYGYVSSNGKSRDALCNSVILEGSNGLMSNNDVSICQTSNSSIEPNSSIQPLYYRDSIVCGYANNKTIQKPNKTTTSPTCSYSPSNTSDDVSKDLQTSLTLMNHALTVCDDETTTSSGPVTEHCKQHELTSLSLNLTTSDNEHPMITSSNQNEKIVSLYSKVVLNKVQISASSIDVASSESNEDTSSASVFLTNSSSSSTASKSNDSKLISTDHDDYINGKQILIQNDVDKWQVNTIQEWLESIGMLPTHIKNALKHVKNGKVLLSLTDHDLESVFFISNQMHKRKIKLALDELKYPEKYKNKDLNNISHKWICNQFLKDIGLKQFQSVFKTNLIDGRVLSTLQRRDFEKYLNIHKRIHQTSILTAIDLLRKYDFNIENLKLIRESQDDPTLWVNESFGDWLKTVHLDQYEDNLNESGLHGALICDNTFNAEFLFEALRIDEYKNPSHKKLIDDEIKLLKKFKPYVKNISQTITIESSILLKYDLLKRVKQESVFQRSLSTLKTDKRFFTLRGSLGRALGKKKQREISSPIVDDLTYRRIECNHKIVDVKSFHMSSVV